MRHVAVRVDPVSGALAADVKHHAVIGEYIACACAIVQARSPVPVDPGAGRVVRQPDASGEAVDEDGETAIAFVAYKT